LKRGPLAPRRVVVTLHDLIWLDHPHAHQVGGTWLTHEWFKHLASVGMPMTLRAADHVICGSNAVAQQVAPLMAPHRYSVVHQGINEVFFEAGTTYATPSTLGDAAGQPYVAAIGTSKPYKNVECLLRAFAQLPDALSHVRLVLIGDDGHLRKLPGMSAVEGRVTITPRVDDVELRAIVAHARLFVVPSLVEGFGLPALEAMALGTPTAAADTPAQCEVTGDGAFHFDPTSPTALAATITEALQNEPAARAIAERGKRRTTAFRWSTTATKTLALYERLLSRTIGKGPF
jgi:glycosyltransferase involved in cell wall biosynthesis